MFQNHVQDQAVMAHHIGEKFYQMVFLKKCMPISKLPMFCRYCGNRNYQCPCFLSCFYNTWFRILSGPLGPSGVIPTREEGCLSILTILTNILDPPLELEPLSIFQPSLIPILDIILHLYLTLPSHKISCS